MPCGNCKKNINNRTTTKKDLVENNNVKKTTVANQNEEELDTTPNKTPTFLGTKIIY
jgi:hypothetical protein